MTVLYVDVSHHDWDRRGGNLDWAAVRQATSQVMCARASYGDPLTWSRPTRHFADFQNGAKAAGFTIRGGYHNLIRGDTASMRSQVDWLRVELDTHGCDWAMLDIERYPELISNDLWPRFADVLRFRDAWHAVESSPLAYYLPQWLYNGYYGGADLRELPGPLIQSHYAGGDGSATQIYANAGGDGGTGWNDQYGGRTPDIWQYSSGADVAGASSNTDVNAFRGSLDELRALLMIGDDVTPEQGLQLDRIEGTLGSLIQGFDQTVYQRYPNGDSRQYPIVLNQRIVALGERLAALEARPPVQPAPVDPAALKAVLMDREVLAAIATAVAEEDHERSAD
jgi:GH25 family lysozyme M1 (1,4-beta-N-acetylmuramidase)